MIFNDNDLKRLKAELDEYPELIDFKIDALLARLEAAEEVVEHFQYKANKGCQECEISLEAWRKAAGK